MCVSVTDDILYIHGGYSKEKVSGQKKEGRIHKDMYVRFVQRSLIVRYSSVQYSSVQCIYIYTTFMLTRTILYKLTHI